MHSYLGWRKFEVLARAGVGITCPLSFCLPACLPACHLPACLPAGMVPGIAFGFGTFVLRARSADALGMRARCCGRGRRETGRCRRAIAQLA